MHIEKARRAQEESANKTVKKAVTQKQEFSWKIPFSYRGSLG